MKEKVEFKGSVVLNPVPVVLITSKNKEGKEFIVSTKCPHLGCQLKWNADELSWDCPCHGSRFDYKGKLIGSPAVKDLHND